MFRWLRHRLRVKLLRLAEEVAERHFARCEQLAERHRRELEELVHRETERLVRLLQEVEFRDRRDIHAAAERYAVASTEQFVREHLPTTPAFPHPQETLEHALSLAPAAGMALEFGVFTGGTLKIIAAARGGREVYGFDSFQGLPEDWRSNIPAGTFRLERPPDVDGAQLVIGSFADTLPGFLRTHPGPVAFAHLDADLYRSTKTALDHIGPRLVPGSVLIFDEYFNYPGWENHEHRAWREFVERNRVRFDYLCYTSNNEQLAVRLHEVNPP